MTDFYIDDTDGDGFDLVVSDEGDLTLTHTMGREAEVGQRVIFRLMTHRGECPYDVTAGLPYVNGIFGAAPVSAIGALLSVEIEETEGVDEIIGVPEYLLDDRTLDVIVTLRIADTDLDLALEIVP